MGKGAGMRKGRMFLAAAILILELFLLGCSVERTEPVKVSDITYHIVEESQIPEELQALIEEKKSGEFKLTFDTGGYRYIAVGYGTQPTGGYSISVEDLFLSPNAIYFNTNLIGPAKGEMVSEMESYPYIVVQMEYLDKNVVFE